MAYIRIWGARGSFPQTGREFSEFGGDTSCFSIETSSERLVLDGGTGLVKLGKKAIKAGDLRPVHIILGHVHLDHILGLLVFPMFYSRDAIIHLYGEERGGRSLRQQIEQIMGPPFWPVGPEGFSAQVYWHSIRPHGVFEPAPGFRVSAMRASHPNQGLIFNIDVEGKHIVYGLDCEIREMNRERLKSFCGDSALVIGDAGDRPGEEECHKGWGHSSWAEWADFAEEADIRKVLCSHYGADTTDAELEVMEREAAGRCPRIHFSREGERVDI